MIGLYVAYVIPVWLRYRQGDRFEAGPWTLGSKYKWMNIVAVVEVLVIVVIGFDVPGNTNGVPFKHGFDWSLFNYTPVVTGGLLLIVGTWWLVSARHTFTGPRRTVDDIDREDRPPLHQAP